MKLIRNIAVAFSLYSQIPMPVFKWEDDDMKHNLVFLPWIGAVIGGLYYGAIKLFGIVDLPMIARAIILSLIPLLITGGFHVDGFMDVEDALKSYKSREEKLVILKDPNIGAFAIISLLKYCLIWLMSMSVILYSEEEKHLLVFASSFFTARTLTGITSLTFQHAKKDGMLNMETEKMNRGDLIFLMIELIAGFILMIYTEWMAGILGAVGMLIFTIYYRHLTYKEFGGVTGDTAGFFIVMEENVCLFMIALAAIIMKLV